MRNMMKDTLIRSSDKGQTDIERQENAMMTSDLCENFVAAACLNESMPFDNQTSEFGECHFFNELNGQRLTIS